jgi:predicted esterase
MSMAALPPHGGQPLVTAGTPLDQARGALVLVHGRGGTAQSMVALAGEFPTEGLALLAPQASGNTWYPYSFLVPMDRNEPGLSSGLSVLAQAVEHAAAAGIPYERIGLLGFSQGACLSLEFVARNARRYGAAIGLSGGLIGPDETPRDYGGSLAGTPVFLGCSDVDSHIPVGRVRESGEVLTRLGGQVDLRLYPGMGHLVNEDEAGAVRVLLAAMVGAEAP